MKIKTTIIIFLIVSLLASITLGFYGRDKFYFIGILSFVALIILASSLFIAIFCWVFGKIKHLERMITISKYIGLVCLSSLIIFSSIFISSALMEYDTEEAKIFCSSLIPKIEKFKTKSGEYPNSIAQIINQSERLPLRIRDFDFYQANDHQFRFVVPIIGPNPSGIVYDSKLKNWELVDFIFDLERL